MKTKNNRNILMIAGICMVLTGCSGDKISVVSSLPPAKETSGSGPFSAPSSEPEENGSTQKTGNADAVIPDMETAAKVWAEEYEHLAEIQNTDPQNLILKDCRMYPEKTEGINVINVMFELDADSWNPQPAADGTCTAIASVVDFVYYQGEMAYAFISRVISGSLKYDQGELKLVSQQDEIPELLGKNTVLQRYFNKLSIQGIECGINNVISGDKIFDMMSEKRILSRSRAFPSLEEARSSLSLFTKQNYPDCHCYYYPCLEIIDTDGKEYIYFDF